MATGQAAGVAAGLSAKRNTPATEIDYEQLKAALLNINATLE
jgi:hypothetical protein